MTYSRDMVRRAAELRTAGMSIAGVAREIGVARSTIRLWQSTNRAARPPMARERVPLHCPDLACPAIAVTPPVVYAYLLGQYLGDGCISVVGNSRRLRITCCDAYPDVMDETEAAMRTVGGANVARVQRQGCTELVSYSRHWVCLFPQHGAGKKHERAIVLRPWQEAIVAAHPAPLVRGLIQSDGCRVMNRVPRRGRMYVYPRYFFSNTSADVMGIFTDACDRMGVAWRMNRVNSVSVAQARSVAILDAAVGPKT